MAGLLGTYTQSLSFRSPRTPKQFKFWFIQVQQRGSHKYGQLAKTTIYALANSEKTTCEYNGITTPEFAVSQSLYIKHPHSDKRVLIRINGREIGEQNKRQSLLAERAEQELPNKTGWIYTISTEENERFILSESELIQLSQVYCKECGRKK